MTTPNPQIPTGDCWVELEAVLHDEVTAPDTFYGRSVGMNGYYPPYNYADLVPGYATYDLVNDTLEVWTGSQWRQHIIQPGDEFIDMATGTVYALSSRTD